MILVDSDILIAHLRGHGSALTWLQVARSDAGPLTISVVSITEIAGGMRSGERHDVDRLLSAFRVAAVSETVAWGAAQLMRQYRRSHSGIGLGDYLIAATAGTYGFQLATLNVAHFPMFEGLAPPFRL